MGDSRASQEGRLMTDPQGCVPTFQVNLRPDADRGSFCCIDVNQNEAQRLQILQTDSSE